MAMLRLLAAFFAFLLICMPPVMAAALATTAGQSELFVQTGHTESPDVIGFSPDGRFLATRSRDKTVKFWDVASGREWRTLTGYRGLVAFSPDWRLAALAGDESGTVKVWEIATGREAKTLAGDVGIYFIAFSPNGRILATGSNKSGDKKTFKFWDVSSGRELRSVKSDVPPVFSSDGRFAVIIDSEGVYSRIAKFFDAASGKATKSIKLDGYSYYESLALSPDGRTLVTLGRSLMLTPGSPPTNHSDIRLWDVGGGKQLGALQYPISGALFAFSPDSRTIVSVAAAGYDNKRITLTDARTGSEIRSLPWKGWPAAVGFSPDGRLIAAKAGGITLWDTASGREVGTLAASGYSYAFSPDGRFIAASGKQDKTLALWDIGNGHLVKTFKGYGTSTEFVRFSPNGSVLAASSSLSGVELREAASGRVIKSHSANYGKNFAFPRDGGWFALARYGNVLLMDTVSGQEKKTLTGSDKWVTSVAVSPDGRLVAASASYGKTIKLWDAGTGSIVRELEDDSVVEAVAFSPDGRVLASGSGDKTLKLWDAASGNRLHVLKGHDHWPVDIAFSPDNRLIASVSPDKTVRVWNVATGSEIKSLTGHTDWVNGVAFSPDGRRLASGGNDGFVRLWDTTSWWEAKTLTGHQGPVKSVAFSPDGTTVVSGGGDGLKLWDASSGALRLSLLRFEGGEWIAITPQGYFDASSPKAAQYLNVRVGNQVHGADQYYERFYRPDIVRLALAGKAITGVTDIASVKSAPIVSIVETPASVSSEQIGVTLKITDTGGGIGEARLYLNDTAVGSQGARNLQVVSGSAKSRTARFNLQLVPGLNRIRAVAFNAEGTMQSAAAVHEIAANIATVRRPALHALVVGINKYENPKLELKYAVPDAELFAATLAEWTQGLFESVTVKKLIAPAETSKTAIVQALQAMQKQVRPDDLFVFYVASHGTVDNSEYFLITSNVGSTSTARLKQDALPQDTLKELLANVPATKKLIVLDTCNAGKLGETLQVAMLTRGMSDDTAMKILSRAVGSTILSAASSVQEALEGYQGHGLFTFVLTEGLKGAADSDKDGFVKTLELADYVDTKVPELAEKVFRHKQYPIVSPSGMGFPVTKVK